jgi:hypothetical protein
MKWVTSSFSIPNFQFKVLQMQIISKVRSPKELLYQENLTLITAIQLSLFGSRFGGNFSYYYASNSTFQSFQVLLGAVVRVS